MEHLSKAIAAVSRVGEVISRTAQSAQELLRDQELRSKGIQTVISGAQTRLQGIQNGIVQRAGRIQERLLDNRRQLQALLLTLEERFNASQRAWQLQARRRDRVDVQFGRQVIENAPQEIRARLWYVLLENPHLAAPLKCEHPGVLQNSLTDDEDDGDEGLVDRAASGAGLARGSAGGRYTDSALIGPLGSTSSLNSTSSRFAAAAAAALGFGRPGGGGGGGSVTSSPWCTGRAESAASLSALGERSVPGRSAGDALGDGLQPTTQQQQQQLTTYTAAASPTQAASGASSAAVTPQTSRASRAGTSSAAAAAAELASAGGAMGDGGGVDSLDGWELVSGVLGTTDPSGLTGPGGSATAAGAAGGAPQPEAFRIIMERLEALGHLALDESGSDPVLVAQQAVLEAMLQVPWEPGVGLPPDASPDSRFAVLNEMTAGQEEVDDSILRDIHRTFPEHPYFGMEAGQRSLFRVLKAYSLHDLEVAYCQGMAFMAGVLLMYVPEETAFRLFCRLMDPEGPNLRRLYLPGLEPLKAELATFELLLTWRLPELAQHLSEFGLPPVLYVSQWLMTLFATPFPPAFCARVIDVLLQDGHDRLLLRCSYAVVEALERELLARHDFEALITYLKMEPVSWGPNRQRAIMERALASPVTDAEIDVARDTVANRKFLAAALAAEAGAVAAAAGAASIAVAAAGSEAGPSGTAAGNLLGPAAAAAATAADPSAVIHQRQRSYEAEVDAALTVAAAAALTTAEGGAGCDRGNGLEEWDVGGRGAAVAELSSVREDRFAREDRAMPSSEEEGAGRRAREEDCAALPVAGKVWEPEWPVDAAAEADRSRGGEGAGTSGAGCSSAAQPPPPQPCGGGGPSAYDMPPSLLDDFGFGCDASGAATAGSKGAELEYGEYGEMLMDAGVLLPELGTNVVAAFPGLAPAVPLAAAAQAAQPAPGSDLLLD